MIYINKWVGRLGNNLIQLCNAHILAERHECKVGYPSEGKANILPPSPPVENVLTSSVFFSSKREASLNFPITESDLLRVSRSKINSLVRKKTIEIPPDVIACHVRSGDVFKLPAHPSYVQPPLSYYLSIFKRECVKDFSRIWVISSSQTPLNPVIKPLRELGCSIKFASLNDSIDILSSAQTLVCSYSTFPKHLFYLSPNSSKLYVADYFLNDLFLSKNIPPLDVKVVNLPNYLKPREWKASPSDINLLLNYPTSSITIE